MTLELQTITSILQSISQYATNLQVVVNTKVVDDVSANLGAAGGSAKKLADDVLKLSRSAPIATEIGSFAGPSANLFAWIVGEYINALQVDAMRKATQAANPVIQGSKDLLEGAAGEVAVATRSALANQLDGCHNEYVLALRDRSRLDHYV